MRPSSAAPLTAAALALAALLAPSQADAFERQWHAGAGIGYALLADGGSYPGIGGSVHLTYGLTDAFNALVELNTASHPGGDLMMLGASAGAAYVLDILQWVPYVGLMAGAYDSVRLAPCGSHGQPDCHSGRFGVSVPFGLDYTFSRQFAVGFAGKYTLLVPGAGDGPGSYFTAFARAEFLWGY
ncbi:hypothetical protein SOCEGT47_022730 [Sorangium cellulosum]|uniref:Outer membrane protein beta-barrel domain-containing protein n=1 Tax=Sorangium cellulosum TaxID=56 RepID=A0A4P2PY30_SORCE|nr:outer membrane beta-barrel protein [Sorangium cellulosum]AUX21785.1 hypothetical protein SOCEGT47_022730 [Sorangium cellulosum]